MQILSAEEFDEYKKRFRTSRLLIAFLVLIGFLVGVWFGIIIDASAPASQAYIRNITNGSSLCGDNLTDTAALLQGELYTFYKYNITNIEARNITEDEFRQNGGVCWQYSDWYKENMELCGYKTRHIIFEMSYDNESLHEIALAGDDTGYCILDQLNIHCQSY